MIYIFSDGYADQFGPKEKYMTTNFRKYLASISDLSVEEQHDMLHKWKGNHDQIDDVCVMGVRV